MKGPNQSSHPDRDDLRAQFLALLDNNCHPFTTDRNAKTVPQDEDD